MALVGTIALAIAAHGLIWIGGAVLGLLSVALALAVIGFAKEAPAVPTGVAVLDVDGGASM